MSGYRFNPPPNWPAPPQGWQPPPGWQPDPAWPTPPAGWELWVPEAQVDPAYHNAWWSGSRAETTAATIPVAIPATTAVTPGFPTPPTAPPTVPPAVPSAVPLTAPPAVPLTASSAAPSAVSPAVSPAVPPNPLPTVPQATLLDGAFGPPAAVLGDEASEVERLRAWIARTQGMDAVQAQDAVRRLREEVAEARAAALSDAEAIRKVARDEARQRQDEARNAEAEASNAHQEAEESHEDLARSRSQLAELLAQITVAEETALLQQAGVYAYRHELADAVAYQAELEAVQGEIKELVKNGQAIHGGPANAAELSAAEGRRLARDLAKLMLRAYNAEADNAVLTMRPHRLDSLVDRLDKCRETIAKLGAALELRVADAYHEARVKELRLTSDFMHRKEEEKEAERATRAREREEATARAKLDRELDRLRKEEQRCRTTLERARKRDDLAAAGRAECELAEAGEKLAALSAQAADPRAGHLYVVSNIGAFGPDLVRIGVSRRPDPLEEIAELSSAAVPFTYDVHAVLRSDDATGLEERLRERFADARVNRVDAARGFYRLMPTQVREALVEFAGGQLVEFTEEPAAPEFRAGIK